MSFWRAVEMFSPPQLPLPPRRGPRVSRREWIQQVDVRRGQPWPALPWEAEHPLQREPIDDGKEVWRHTIYGGVFPQSAVKRLLEEHFGADEEDFAGARQQRGDSAAFAVTVDARGVLLEGAEVFSTCAWATGRVRSPGPDKPDWLDGFDDVERACIQAISMLTRHHVPYPRHPSTVAGPAPEVPAAETSGTGQPGETGQSGWRSIVQEILGGAAVGALTALVGDFGAGVVAGALTPVARRITRSVRADSTVAPSAVEPAGPAADADAGRENPAGNPAGGVGDDGPDAQDDEDGGRPIELPDLMAFAAHIADLCGVEDLLSPASIRIHSYRVRRKKDGSLPDADPAFLNSLLPEDLERVAEADSYGAALHSYLSEAAEIDEGRRIDVREQPEWVLHGVAPEQMPLGRWPAPVDQPLALSQQFAVNQIMAELHASRGLFSVNGPPGTGKTTMLRDLIAAIIVERAVRLAELDDPCDGFDGVAEWKDQGVPRRVALPVPELTGHEIVVASSNNGAVENITTELPALDAIGDDWRCEASYFLDQGVALLEGAPAWGAIAAPLGKAEKRRDFMGRWWWGDTAQRKSTRGWQGTSQRGGQAKSMKAGMHGLLRRLEEGDVLRDPPAHERYPAGGGTPSRVMSTADAVDGWAAAKSAFEDAVREVRRMQATRAGTAHAQRDQAGLSASATRAEHAAAEAARRHEAAAQDAHRTQVTFQQASVCYEQGRDLATGHQTRRPSGFRSAMGAGREYREWQTTQGHYDAARDAAFLQLGEVRSQHVAAERVEAEAREISRHARSQWTVAVQASEQARAAVAEARADWGEHFPEGWEHWEDDRRELSSPWSDEEFCAARTRLFLAALNLHRTFVVANAGTVRRNLLHLKELLAGRVPAAPAKAVWQSLFLVMPVISTTFASCGRLFAALEGEALGWLLIDEAGQATPQDAVGALWRARRAVLVGDPLQLEPVVTLPLAVQERLREAYGIDRAWLPSQTSAQRVADRLNRWGTTVKLRRTDGDTEPVWVGAPLRVHRRCEQPMFGLSNDIAYGGLMVYGTRTRVFPGSAACSCADAEAEGCRSCRYPRSCWVDVAAGETTGKWAPQEGAALVRLLTRLHHQWGVDLTQIRVLSPFRDVVAGCRRTVRGMRLEATVPPGVTRETHHKQVDTFIENHVGTVHTMQGKESDVVILVLGTDPRRDVRARHWAAETPNLLNVAVSRAKRRLFVVGRLDKWRDEPHFELLADPDRLPCHSWPGA